MSGRFVRASKFRHVHGEATRKDKCYLGVKAVNTGEGAFVKANGKFVAFAGTGGGGPVVIHRREETGRLDVNAGTVNVHKATVLDFDFNPFVENVIATAGEDLYVKVSVFPENGLKSKENVEEAAATMEGHQKKVSILHFHPCASNILGSCSFDNTIKVWDVEKQANIFTNDFPDLPQGFEWNASGSLIGTACKDKNAYVYDPRVSNKAAMTAPVSQSKGARFVWMENHNKVAVVGSNGNVRSFAVYDINKFGEPLATADIDQSAGIILPYYDADTSMLYLGGKGDSGFRYYEVTDEDPYVHFLSEFRTNEAQKGLGFLPKRYCDTKTCEVAVAFRLMVDYIQPVSFQVPRKSEQFQEDIFPDAYAGIPVLTADEWTSGANKEPALVSMRPGAQEPRSNAVAPSGFKPSKSAAQLEKELTDSQHQLELANQKIKELEAELARLKGH